MDRRGFLVGATLASLPAWPAAFAADAPIEPDDLRTAAREAWLYGLSITELARVRAAAIGDAPQAGTPGFNAFAHVRQPMTPRDRDLSGPEADVLYSSAWLYLDNVSATLSLPPTGHRYVLTTVSDMYGNVLASIEGRETAAHGRDLLIEGPARRMGVAGYTAPMPRMPVVGRTLKTPSQWVWVLVRIQLEGGRDLEDARRIQDGLTVRVKPSAPRPAPAAALNAPWNDYFFGLQQLIDENPPPSSEANFFRRLAPLQVGIGGGFERARFADPDLAAIAAGVADACTLSTQVPREDAVGGWRLSRADFGQDFLYRARSVLAETAPAPADKVATWRALPPDGEHFAADRRYRVRLPGPPPSGAGWSLTLYRVTPEGRLVLADNTAGRYAVGAWSPGLVRRPDGAIEIDVGGAEPDRANWLPTPEDGPFALILRAHAPAPGLTERWRPAPVEAI